MDYIDWPDCSKRFPECTFSAVVQWAMLTIIFAMLIQVSVGTGLIPASLYGNRSPFSPQHLSQEPVVLADVPVDARGRIGEIKILQGLGPFKIPRRVQSTMEVQSGEPQWPVRGIAGRGIYGISTPRAGNTGVGGPSSATRNPNLQITTTPLCHLPSRTWISAIGHDRGCRNHRSHDRQNGSPTTCELCRTSRTELCCTWCHPILEIHAAMEAGQPVNGTPGCGNVFCAAACDQPVQPDSSSSPTRTTVPALQRSPSEILNMANPQTILCNPLFIAETGKLHEHAVSFGWGCPMEF